MRLVLMLAGKPDKVTTVPTSVQVLARGESIEPVWENALGGLTFALGSDGRRRFVKWAPEGTRLDLPAEARRLDWAGRFTPVPQVLSQGSDSEGSWMLTAALPGKSAVSERWLSQPARAVAAIGTGLRALHDSLPVDACPFSWVATERLEHARQRWDRGAADRAQLHESHQHLSIEQAFELVDDVPPVDRLVVCHGDSCAPNSLITDDGQWSGHVDLGALGVADRWADLAVATWSTQWNYGTGWEGPLLEAYGIEPDRARMSYYRLLWDLGP